METMRNAPASPERIGRYRRGRASEWLAAAALLVKGYRILARRARTPHGEIDLIAVRGRRLAFVEVKRRATRAEAEAAITPQQAARIARAAEFWVSRNPGLRDHERGLDVVFVVPSRWPL
jgi:putative endonuclease